MIINNIRFEQSAPRVGSKVDEKNIVQLLRKLDYNVLEPHKDLTAKVRQLYCLRANTKRGTILWGSGPNRPRCGSRHGSRLHQYIKFRGCAIFVTMK